MPESPVAALDERAVVDDEWGDDYWGDRAIPPIDMELEHAFAAGRLSWIPKGVEAYAACSNRELESILDSLVEQQRIVAGHTAVVMGLMAERSRAELGLSGLARSRGHRNVEDLLQEKTGASMPEVKKAVELGRVVVEAAQLPDPTTGELREATTAWLHAAAGAVRDARISMEQFRAIKDGIGVPRHDVTVAILTDAVAHLIEIAVQQADGAPGLDTDRLRSAAKELRDQLDEAGIRDREAALREQRSFKITRLPDGTSRVVWILDPESAVIVQEIFDRVTSPKLGGPRFVDSEQVKRAETIEKDPRTPFQLASDEFVELLRQGVDHDPSRLLGDDLPAVRIAVTAQEWVNGVGHGILEHTNQALSIETVQRLACAQGIQLVTFDEGLKPLDVGRRLRRYTRKQRIAMAVRDGGCLMCGRPPSWCEAHHILEWVKDRGPTNIDDGALLCRSCHLRVHNEGWTIRRASEAERSTFGLDTHFMLIPPEAVDRARTPRALTSRSRIMRQLATG